MDEILDTKAARPGYGNRKNLPNSTAVLVLGIVSIIGCFLYAIPGVVCGIIALVLFKKDKQVYMQDPVGYELSYKNSKAGQVCAIVGLCLSGIFLLTLIWVFTMAFTVFPGRSF